MGNIGPEGNTVSWFHAIGPFFQFQLQLSLQQNPALNSFMNILLFPGKEMEKDQASQGQKAMKFILLFEQALKPPPGRQYSLLAHPVERPPRLRE